MFKLGWDIVGATPSRSTCPGGGATTYLGVFKISWQLFGKVS